MSRGSVVACRDLAADRTQAANQAYCSTSLVIARDSPS